MFTIVLTYKFSNEWLQKSVEERRKYNEQYVAPIIDRYSKDIQVRFFDAEAFCVRFTDFAIFEAKDLQQYYYFIEDLRETPMVSEGLLIFVEFFMGIEDGYKQYEEDRLKALS